MYRATFSSALIYQIYDLKLAYQSSLRRVLHVDTRRILICLIKDCCDKHSLPSRTYSDKYSICCQDPR
nr:MAG TPA: hypothetical protein [Caudoviricetes sp.]